MSPSAAELESTAITAAAADDLGPLAWISGEIQKTLESVGKALRRFAREGAQAPEPDTGPLRMASVHLHQAMGALQMVGHSAPAQVLGAMNAAVQLFTVDPVRCTDAAAQKVDHAGFAVCDYLHALLSGKAVPSVALFPQYREVLELAGNERVHPADLWEYPWRWAEIHAPANLTPMGYDAEMRARLDRDVLKVVKGSDDDEAPWRLRTLCLGLARGSRVPRATSFWMLAAGFFEAVGLALVPADIYVKRAASRVLMQYTTLARGDTAVSDRLGQDLLFYCAQAIPGERDKAGTLRAVRAAWGIATTQAVDYTTAQFGRFDPQTMAQARKRIAAAKELWSALAAGDVSRTRQVADAFVQLGESLQKLHPSSQPMVEALDNAVEASIGSGRPPSTELAMEVATSVLYLEAAFDDLDPQDKQLTARTLQLAERIERARAGGRSELLTPWMEELYRRVSDRHTMGTVVDELRAHLAELEKSLDQFFRRPSDKAPLRAVPGQLQQMRGVFSVLGLEQAAQTVQHMRLNVDGLLADAGPLGDARDFELLGNNLGALGFLIDMLGYQPALARRLFMFDEASGELRSLLGGQGSDLAGAALSAQAATGAVLSVEDIDAQIAAKLAALAPPRPAADTRPAPLAASAPPAPPAPPASPIDDFSRATDSWKHKIGGVGLDDHDMLAATEVTELEDEDLQNIFLEEARDVLQSGMSAVATLMVNPAETGEMTVLRRAFHTLKGSSRMVGFMDFGEAAWSFEQLVNTWLAEQRPPTPELLGAADRALHDFENWVEAIAAGRPHGWTPSDFTRIADALRDGLPMPPVERLQDAQALAVAARQIAAEPPMAARAPEAPAPFAPSSVPPATERPLTVAPLDFELAPLPHFANLPDLELEVAAPPVSRPSVPAPRPAADWFDPGLELGDDFVSTDFSDFETRPAAPEPAPVFDNMISFDPDWEIAPLSAPPVSQPAPAPEPFAPPPVFEPLAGWQPERQQPSALESAPERTTEPALQPEPEPLFALVPTTDPEPPSAVLPAAEPVLHPPEPKPWPTTREEADVLEAVDLDAPNADVAERSAFQAAPEPAVEPTFQPAAEPAFESVFEPAFDPAFELQAWVTTEPEPSPSPAPVETPPSAFADALPPLDFSLEPPPQTAFDSAAASFDAPAPLTVEPVAQEWPPLDDATLQPAPAVEPQAAVASEPAAPSADDPVKAIGPLRIGIALYNVYLNEADEWSRQLGIDVGEWALETHERIADTTIHLAHSLAGSSATVGFQGLSDMARLFESALQHLQRQGRGTPEQGQVLVAAADEIRWLLHQFAAGFLKDPAEATLTALRDVAESLSPASMPMPLDSMPVPLSSVPAPAPVFAPVSEPAPAPAPVPALAPAPYQPIAQPLSMPTSYAPAQADVVLDDDADLGHVTDSIDPDLFPVFVEEAAELLPQLGVSLRTWMHHTDDPAPRAATLRTLHTLKGSARLAGAMQLGERAHRLESEIEALGTHGVDRRSIEQLLVRFDGLGASFDALRAAGVPPAPPAMPDAVAFEQPAPRVQYAPPAEQAFANDNDSFSPPVEGARALAAPLPALRPLPTPPALVQPRLSGNQAVRIRAHLLDRLVAQAGEVIITRSRIEVDIGQLRASLADLTDNLDRLRQQLRDVEVQAESQMQSRLAQAKDSQQGFDPLEFDRFTRVQELTRMMAESVNDVATVQRTLQKTVQSTEDGLSAQARQTRELQRGLLRTRMVEFEGIADRLYRVVRQAAKESGRQVRLDIVGGSIEMDRGVLDRMTPAFEHLLRNSVAHGIEDVSAREWAGKDATGLIAIELRQEGNDVSVVFRDDGAGLDLQRIGSRAYALGLVPYDAEVSPELAADLIFRAGFSTADQVSELAGRGIGMDVVRTEVAALGGRIETHTTRGRGTEFKLVLPLTTAVTHVVMLRIGAISIGVPSSLVELVQRPGAADLETAYRTQHHRFGNEDVPFYWAGALLQSSARSERPVGKANTILIVRSAAQRVALHVDEVLGNQEVVVKNLGPQLSRLAGMAGISVLASGAVALIYNPVALAVVHGDEARALQARDSRAQSAPSAGEVAAAAAPLVLVVDDSITVRRVTQRLLQREGFRVALANDGLQALERLKEERPAVVLSDIEMPRMDGFDLARAIRADAAWADLPIIMISSRIAEKHREHAASLGVQHYLGKPYAEEELLRAVRRFTATFVASRAG